MSEQVWKLTESCCRDASERLKRSLESHETSVVIQRRIYVDLPSVDSHHGHLMGVVSVVFFKYEMYEILSGNK